MITMRMVVMMILRMMMMKLMRMVMVMVGVMLMTMRNVSYIEGLVKHDHICFSDEFIIIIIASQMNSLS